MNDFKIDILLSTYNGGLFIRDQIESILSQSCSNWRLLVRDDGSDDKTPDIVDTYQAEYPKKIVRINSGKSHLGVVSSYARLLEYSRAGFVMFSDQDDVWLNDKITTSLERMCELEEKYSPGMPILLHTDLCVTDTNLNVIDKSFMKYQGLNPNTKRMNRLLIQNNMTGCTMMLNRALLNAVLPIPQEARMYDWWIGLAASSFGVVDFIDKPTVLYRQHEHNVVGAKRLKLPKVLLELSKLPKIRQDLHANFKQAAVFLQRYDKKIEADMREMIYDFSRIGEESYFRQKKIILQRRFFKQYFLRNLVLLAMVI